MSNGAQKRSINIFVLDHAAKRDFSAPDWPLPIPKNDPAVVKCEMDLDLKKVALKTASITSMGKGFADVTNTVKCRLNTCVET